METFVQLLFICSMPSIFFFFPLPSMAVWLRPMGCWFWGAAVPRCGIGHVTTPQDGVQLPQVHLSFQSWSLGMAGKSFTPSPNLASVSPSYLVPTRTG